MVIARTVRSLYSHRVGPFESLSALCHAALHYLPCGSHYLPCAGVGGHCGHFLGIICRSWAFVVIARAVRSLRCLYAGSFDSLSALRHASLHYQPYVSHFLPCGSHFLLCAGLGGPCGHCVGIICLYRACVAIMRAVRSLHDHCACPFESLSAVHHAAIRESVMYNFTTIIESSIMYKRSYIIVTAYVPYCTLLYKYSIHRKSKTLRLSKTMNQITCKSDLIISTTPILTSFASNLRDHLGHIIPTHATTFPGQIGPLATENERLQPLRCSNPHKLGHRRATTRFN